jgi:hypothetical protein
MRRESPPGKLGERYPSVVHRMAAPFRLSVFPDSRLSRGFREILKSLKAFPAGA